MSCLQAYYALAKQLHPDTNKAPDAEAKFQEVQKAYETLKDDEQRRIYDQIGHSNFEEGASASGGPGMGGNPFGGSPFGNPFAGGRRFNEDDFDDLLGSIFGGGMRPSRDIAVELKLDFMDAARGSHKTIQLQTKSGVRTVDIDIPAGVDTGMRLRVDGMGQPSNGRQPAGHLYVTVNVREHPRFQRDGADIHVEVPITIDVAALGGTVSVPTLDGSSDVNVPAGSQPGDTMVLRGRGLPHVQRVPGVPPVGDQYVRLAVQVPRKLTARQKELLQEFGSLERNKRDAVYRSADG